MLNSIIKESIFLTRQAKHNKEEIELHRRQEQKRRRNKNNEASQVANQRSNGDGDEGRGNQLRLNVGVLNQLNLCGFVPGFIFYLGLVGDLFSFFFYHVGLFFASWGLIWSRFVLCCVGFDLAWVCSLPCGFVFRGKKRKEIKCVRLDFH